MRLFFMLSSSTQSSDTNQKSNVSPDKLNRNYLLNWGFALFVFFCALLRLYMSFNYSSQFTMLIVHFPYFQQIKLSPQLQDLRWDNFKKSFCSHQANLTASKEQHYVLYSTTYSGLANKVDGLVSSLLIAMLTNRGFKCIKSNSILFVVADWKSFDSYFDLPLVNHHLSRFKPLFPSRWSRAWLKT